MPLEYEIKDLIREPQLPANWFETTLQGFSAIAPYYRDDLSRYAHVLAARQTSEMMAAHIAFQRGYASVMERGFMSVADIGVGDGERLANISLKVGMMRRVARLYGTDLSTQMLEKAAGHGIGVVRHDMRQPLPFSDGSLDMILSLSGTFGFIQDSQNGFEQRVNALNSMYSALRRGGALFMELFEHDTDSQEKDGWVSVYDRKLSIDGQRDETFRFFLKLFRFGEVQRLFKASMFPADRVIVNYMIWVEPQKPGSEEPDCSNSGTITRSYEGFRGFDIRQIHPNISNRDAPRTSYVMLVVAEKV